MQFFDGFDPEKTEKTIRCSVEQFDERTGHLHEYQGRTGKAPRHRFRLGDREILRSKLTKDHLRNSREHECQSNPEANPRRLADTDRFEHWPEHACQDGLGNKTEHQRRDRDAELRSGEHETQALMYLDRPLGLAVATFGSLNKLGTPRRNERKLSCNEIPVRRDQNHDSDEPESNLH